MGVGGAHGFLIPAEALEGPADLEPDGRPRGPGGSPQPPPPQAVGPGAQVRGGWFKFLTAPPLMVLTPGAVTGGGWFKSVLALSMAHVVGQWATFSQAGPPGQLCRKGHTAEMGIGYQTKGVRQLKQGRGPLQEAAKLRQTDAPSG